MRSPARPADGNPPLSLRLGEDANRALLVFARENLFRSPGVAVRFIVVSFLTGAQSPPAASEAHVVAFTERVRRAQGATRAAKQRVDEARSALRLARRAHEASTSPTMSAAATAAILRDREGAVHEAEAMLVRTLDLWDDTITAFLRLLRDPATDALASDEPAHSEAFVAGAAGDDISFPGSLTS